MFGGQNLWFCNNARSRSDPKSDILGIQKRSFCKRSFTKASLLCANLRFAAARSLCDPVIGVPTRSRYANFSVAFVSKGFVSNGELCKAANLRFASKAISLVPTKLSASQCDVSGCYACKSKICSQNGVLFRLSMALINYLYYICLY